MPAAKKDPSVRRRRNRGPGQAALGEARRARRPRLPQYVPGTNADRWHPMVLLWWDAVWTSPMARGFIHTDARGLLRLAVLEHFYWAATEVADRIRLSAEIRLQQQAYGLTPYDRRRLEWTIEVTEEAQDRGRKRREAADAPPAGPVVDPRSTLRVV